MNARVWFTGRRLRHHLAIVLLAAGLASCGENAPTAPERQWWVGTASEQARAILDMTEKKRGIAVVLGDPTGELALELARESKLTVYCQLPRAEDVRTARRAVATAGLYGTRIYVERGALDRLHLADNLADILIASGDSATVPEIEALRVVRPLGVVLRGGRQRTKPPLEGADDWSHPYHGPDNNPQSDGTLARAPYLTQFLADPRYAPVPQVAVAAGGRVFKAFGNVAFKRREEPWLNRLVAINGYNGSMLWIRNLAPGFMIHRNTLIATRDTLYLGDDKSCKVIDAATGELLDEIVAPAGLAAGTCFKWMGIEGGVLFALTGEAEPPDPVQRHGREQHGWPWDKISEGHNATEYAWGYGRNLLAIDLGTKAVLWSHTEEKPIDSRAVCMKAGRIHLFSAGAYLVSLDASTGDEIWRKTAPAEQPAPADPKSTLRLTIRSIDRSEGTVTISGVDTRRPATPFTWSWGDGTSGKGFFPQGHRYGDVDRDYVVAVTAHYPDGETDRKEATVSFRESQTYSREDAPEFFDAIGPLLDRQGWATNWRTACYLKCSTDALYFSGTQVGKLLAVSAADGSVLWEHPYDNFQLVLREEGLYGISGPFDVELSRLFDPLTGEVRASLPYGRRGCTRPTGSPDALLFRARGGSARLDVESGIRQWISPMRAQCQDGVTIANGYLYWWPSVCDCNLTLYGVTCLGPAGNFDFRSPAADSERRETVLGPDEIDKIEALEVVPADWPTFRANNTCTATSLATVVSNSEPTWTYSPPVKTRPTAPVTAGGLVFLGGADGIVRAVSAASGELRWRACTGGGIRIPPTISDGRALVGSGDGWVYCYEAATGRQLWRFRAAPVERKIPVYGQLLSTWPVASGILVEDGIAYFAAGIVNFDGTHVYALDVKTGRLIWHNGTSGHLDETARTGVSVQGHLLLRGAELYLSGGTAVSPARYDVATGKCLNSKEQLAQCEARGSRGWELYQIGTKVVACGRPYYADPRFRVFDSDVFSKLFVAPVGRRDVVLIDDERLMCFPRIDTERLNDCVANRDEQGWFSYRWGEFKIPDDESLWSRDCTGTMAISVGQNAVVLAKEAEITAVDLVGGKDAWSHPLPAKPVRWGLAIDRDGQSIVTLEDGRVLGFGARRR